MKIPALIDSAEGQHPHKVRILNPNLPIFDQELHNPNFGPLRLILKHSSTTFHGTQCSDSSECSPRKGHSLSLVLSVKSSPHKDPLGSLLGTSVLNIGVVCEEGLSNRVERRILNFQSDKMVDVQNNNIGDGEEESL
ncbi:hypothetical protein PIB30_083169 [Stylosanthes scabra]|uniref:Uncharacterized protein n=1 Tax=Stylosanthes scabra TaxID=79078 RepID=A0ABU6UUV6_9FABA|nr:hypothetical protein [Stylosanthes scabra]